MTRIDGKSAALVRVALCIGALVWQRAARADELVFESFTVENVHMYMVCDALRLANCSVSTHLVEPDCVMIDGSAQPKAYYRDASGRAIFCVSREPLLSFSLQRCTADQILTEACRLSGEYDLTRRKNRWYVLQRDSELPTTIITRRAFAGKIREFFYKDHVLKDYYKAASGESRRIVRIPAVEGQSVADVFDLVTDALGASYWTYSDSWGYWEYEAEMPRNIPRHVDIRFPELFEVARNPEERDTPLTNQLAVATDLDGVTTICLEAAAKKIAPHDPIEKLRLFLRHPPQKLRTDIERVALDISHADEELMNSLHGVWEPVELTPLQPGQTARLPLAFRNDIQVAKHLPKSVRCPFFPMSTVCGSGYIDLGVFRGPCVISTLDHKTFELLFWSESVFDPAKDDRIHSDVCLMTLQPATDGQEATLTLKHGNQPVTYRPLREEPIDKK